jgi:hypothetical protein
MDSLELRWVPTEREKFKPSSSPAQRNFLSESKLWATVVKRPKGADLEPIEPAIVRSSVDGICPPGEGKGGGIAGAGLGEGARAGEGVNKGGPFTSLIFKSFSKR